MRTGLAGIFRPMNRLGSRIAAAITAAAGISFAVLVGGVGGSSANHNYGEEHHAPVCSTVQPSLTTLNSTGRFIKVSLSGATDPDGDALTYAITSVTQDEPVIGPPGTTSPDAMTSSDANAVLLRAERDPRGDGRVYEISFTVTDTEGDSCDDSVFVSVPRKKGEAATDSGQAFDSFTGDPIG
jgi:hypothetical protein